MIEVLLFVVLELLDEKIICDWVFIDFDLESVMEEFVEFYLECGVNFVNIFGKWFLRIVVDLSFLMEKEWIELCRLFWLVIEMFVIIVYY